MRFRKLRIAWSVVWGVVAVLLVVLWVRSYFGCDLIQRVDLIGETRHHVKEIGTNDGTLYYSEMDLPLPETKGWRLMLSTPYVHETKHFDWYEYEWGRGIVLPLWIIVP